MPELELRYDVFVPGEDIPRTLETEAVLSEGDLVTIDGREWLVERVDLLDAEAGVAGQAHVAPVHEPA